MTLVPSKTPLTHFKLLSFDIYGTLIDWEGGVYKTFTKSAPISRFPPNHPLQDKITILHSFERAERPIQVANPGLEYSELLSQVYKRILQNHKIDDVTEEEIEEAGRIFGDSVGEWPAFPDTIDALERLKKHYHLVPLTNSSPKTFGASLSGPFAGFDFSAYYTAADIGSYKPDLRNFDYLFKHCKDEFGVEKSDILHVAQSLHHDHEPANKVDLESCWVDRDGVMGTLYDGNGDGKAEFGWEVKSLEELADAVEEAFEGVGK
ncbi:HAD-like protein [Tothia fuscella]|uniref:HAD-like protein n=1 Tax=Tothia fuscella TaxID=1048955 RepID=A0A9P4TZ88_9PEZI|nr:HAD-like protein [Tothia fuscella]